MKKTNTPEKQISPLEQEIEVLKGQLSLTDDKYKRALADYQNQEKRHASQRTTFIKLANESLLDKIIPVIDDLQRAQVHLNDPGLGQILKQFSSILETEGLTVISSDGQDFDPEIMDCAEVVAGPKDKVVRTILKGYRFQDKILRPAKVEVGGGVGERNPA